MVVSYDVFTGAFLNKISEFEFLNIDDDNRAEIVDGYMKRAMTAFRKNCLHNLKAASDDTSREFNINIADGDLDEIVEIISEGMVVQWMKPYVYNQELLENVLNTRDYTQYSPGELLRRVGSAYEKVQRDYTQMIREYSYNHGALGELHS